MRWMPLLLDGERVQDEGTGAHSHVVAPAPTNTPRPTEPGEKVLQGGPRSERLA